MSVFNWSLSAGSTPLRVAVATTVSLLAAAFIGAWATQSQVDLFSLVPQLDDPLQPIPEEDIISENNVFTFHLTFYTAWATFLATLPAFCLVWFRNSIAQAGRYWLAFWTTGFFAMIIHLIIAIGMLYGWDWQHVLNNTVRVTIPIPDLVLTAWWGWDVSLAWRMKHERPNWVRIQRIAIHVLLLFVFLMGFIKEGELILSRAIGVGAVVALILAVVLGVMTMRKKTSA